MKMTEIKGKNGPAQKIKQAIKELSRNKKLIGIIVCIVSCILATWVSLVYEREAASTAMFLNETRKSIAVIHNPNRIPKGYENRLVYVSGPLQIAEPLTDPKYGVTVNSVMLVRRAPEYRVQLPREDYNHKYHDHHSAEQRLHPLYTTEWTDKSIKSNPTSRLQMADKVKIGAVTLGLELKQTFKSFIEVTSSQRPKSDGMYYPNQQDVRYLQLGDVKVRFYYSGKAGDTYSVIGKLENGTIVPFVAPNGRKMLLQRKNTVPVDQMFHREYADNNRTTSLCRLFVRLTFFSCLLYLIKTTNFLKMLSLTV